MWGGRWVNSVDFHCIQNVSIFMQCTDMVFQTCNIPSNKLYQLSQLCHTSPTDPPPAHDPSLGPNQYVQPNQTHLGPCVCLPSIINRLRRKTWTTTHKPPLPHTIPLYTGLGGDPEMLCPRGFRPGGPLTHTVGRGVHLTIGVFYTIEKKMLWKNHEHGYMYPSAHCVY